MTTRLASVRLLVEDELSRLPADSFFFFLHSSVQFCSAEARRSPTLITRDPFFRIAIRTRDKLFTDFHLTKLSLRERSSRPCAIAIYTERFVFEEGVSFSRKKREQLIPLCSKSGSNAVVKPLLNLFAGRAKEGPPRYQKMLAGRFPREGKGEEAKEKKGWPAIISPSVVASYLRRGCNGRNVRRLANIGLDRIGGRKSTLLRESGSEQLPPRDATDVTFSLLFSSSSSSA